MRANKFLLYLLTVAVLLFAAGCEQNPVIDFQPDIDVEGSLEDDLVLEYGDTVYYPGSRFTIPLVVTSDYTGTTVTSIQTEWSGSFFIRNLSPRSYRIISSPGITMETVYYDTIFQSPQRYANTDSNLPATQLTVSDYSAPPQDMLAPEDSFSFMIRFTHSNSYGNGIVEAPLNLVAESDDGTAVSFAFDIYGIMSC